MVVLSTVVMATNGCATSRQIELAVAIRALRPPEDMICADGHPVRLLVDSSCRQGVCGWSCLPDRWTP